MCQWYFFLNYHVSPIPQLTVVLFSFVPKQLKCVMFNSWCYIIVFNVACVLGSLIYLSF